VQANAFCLFHPLISSFIRLPYSHVSPPYFYRFLDSGGRSYDQPLFLQEAQLFLNLFLNLARPISPVLRRSIEAGSGITVLLGSMSFTFILSL